MDIPEIRRRVRAAIEQARLAAAARRERSDAAAKSYEQFLATWAVPAFNTMASALVAEGHRFKVTTPAGSVGLASERSPDDYVELTLDSSETSARRARPHERRPGSPHTDEGTPRSPRRLAGCVDRRDVVTFVLAEIITLIER